MLLGLCDRSVGDELGDGSVELLLELGVLAKAVEDDETVLQASQCERE